jgi:hypothetical protein
MPDVGVADCDIGLDPGRAMSDPESAQRRRPPTIDLTAQEVKTEQPTDANESPAASTAGRDSARPGGAGERGAGRTARRTAPYVFTGLIGAAAAALIAGLWFAGVLGPQREGASMQRAATPTGSPAPASTEMTEIEARLDKIQGALQAKPPDADLTARIAGVEARMKALGDSVAALARRVDEIGAATRDIATEAKAAASAAALEAKTAKTAAQSGVQSGELDRITRRVTALEDAVKTLTADAARSTSSADDRTARAAIAAAALAAALARGAPFRAELASVTTLGADENAVAALMPFAEGGLPSAEILARELIQLLPTLRQAVPAPKESSLLARLEVNAQKLVRITRTDSAPAGDDPSSIIARVDMDARNNDLAGALADIARLPAQPRALAEGWVQKAKAREEAIAASRRVEAEAVAAIGKPAPQ